MTTTASSSSRSESGPAKSGGNPGLNRHVGPVGLLFAGIGSIIGSGWLFGAFNASQLAGPAAIFSWLLAAVMILFIGLTYAELGPMFPIGGGVVRFPHLVWGSFASYSFGWITWISTAAVPAIEVEGALQYATRYGPFTTKHTLASGDTTYTLTALGLTLAIVLLAVFIVVNYYGVRLFAQINNVLVWWKLAIILLVIITFFVLAFSSTKVGGTSNYGDYPFFAQGGHGVFLAISTAGITFSFLGFRQGIELAGETENPKRNVPLAVIGSVLITGVIYALLQIAFTLTVPSSALSNGWTGISFTDDFGPLAAISSIAGVTWLAYLLYADAIISPADTGLVYTTVSARVSYAMAKNDNAPQVFARTSSRGVPIWGLVLTFVIGVILFLPFPSWQQLVGFITSATVISFGTGPLVVAALRRSLPDKERPFKLPGGDIIPFIAFYAANMIVYWAGWTTNSKVFATVVIGYIVLAALEVFGRKQDKPSLDIRHSAPWVLPWLGGMALIAWLMDPEKHENLFNWAFLANLVLAAVIFALAVRMRPPRETIDRHVRVAEAEAADEGHEVA